MTVKFSSEDTVSFGFEGAQRWFGPFFKLQSGQTDLSCCVVTLCMMNWVKVRRCYKASLPCVSRVSFYFRKKERIEKHFQFKVVVLWFMKGVI